MSFGTAGFLSGAMDRFRTSLRAVPSYRLWFEFAEDLNRLGLDMLRDHEPPRHDNQKLTVTALFVRAHQSLPAALLLVERGMLNDARVILRSAVEGVIALTALANNPAFLDQMIAAHRFNQRKLARLTLNSPDYRSAYSPEEIAQMEATVAEVDASEAAAIATDGKPLRDINWAEVDPQHCKDLYGLMYRLFSGDGTHTNINAINRFMEFDAGGQLTGFRVGPNT